MQTIEIFSPEDAKVSLAAGETLFKEGDSSDFAYVLVEGSVEIIVNRRISTGFEKIVTKQVVETAGVGSLIGEMALVENMPRSAAVVAVTDCKFVAIDQKRFQTLIQQHPYFAIQVMQIMAERLRNMNQLLTG